MKKSQKIFITAVLIILSLSTQINLIKANEVADNDSTIIQFDNIEYDYGKIDQNNDGSCIFKFKNTGEHPLLITNVRSSCGCTVPFWPKEAILPGNTGQIKVKYDTKRMGAFHKSITVRSNAKTIVLKIKGEVKTK